MARICIFGDSIAWGHNDNTSGGWAEILRKYFLKSNLDFSVYNLSISKDSTRELLERFDTEAKARKPEIIIFAIGVNDSFYLDDDKRKVNVKIEDFKKNLEELYKKAKKYSKKIVFVSLFECDESKTKPVSWNKSIYHDNANIREYNDIIKEFAIKNKVHFIDLMKVVKKTHLDDGLHPHPTGHERIYESVREFLLKKVIF